MVMGFMVYLGLQAELQEVIGEQETDDSEAETAIPLAADKTGSSKTEAQVLHHPHNTTTVTKCIIGNFVIV